MTELFCIALCCMYAFFMHTQLDNINYSQHAEIIPSHKVITTAASNFIELANISNTKPNVIHTQQGGTGLTWIPNNALLLGNGNNPVHSICCNDQYGLVLLSQESNHPYFGVAPICGGGTGNTNFIPNALIAGGTTSTGALQQIDSQTEGHVLISHGTALPQFQALPTVSVTSGGTGQTILTNHGVLLGQGTSSIATTSVGTNGQILLGSTGANPTFVTPTAGTGLQISSNATTLDYALSVPVSVTNGGTGITATSAYAILCGGITATSALQSITNVETSNQLLTSNGSNTLPTFKSLSINIQTFKTSGIYIPTQGMIYCIVEAMGAGGGGGGCDNGIKLIASGGGSGSFSRLMFSASTIGASQTVTIGIGGAGGIGGRNGSAGGTTSLGSLITAPGGKGGLLGATSIVLGGAGGDAGIGNVVTGFSGQSTSGFSATGCLSGAGANSLYGQGGYAVMQLSNSAKNGISGQGYGSGGSGAATGLSNGGAGASGYLTITEFILA